MSNGIQQAIKAREQLIAKCLPFKKRILELIRADVDDFQIMMDTGLNMQEIMHIVVDLEADGLVRISGKPGTPMKIKLIEK